MPRQIRSLAERLKARTDSSGGPSACWPWKGPTNGAAGYGMLYSNRDFPDSRSGGRLAHRVAYALAYGNLDSQQAVLHTCDNPICCNPAHLVAGTLSDNSNDMARKLRGRHRLTEEQARAVLADPRPSCVVAAAYGISRATVGRIKRKDGWAWL